jgi:hypothetical protein
MTQEWFAGVGRVVSTEAVTAHKRESSGATG